MKTPPYKSIIPLIRAAGNLDLSAAEPVLIEHLSSENRQIVEAAVDALSKVGGRDAIMPLKDRMKQWFVEDELEAAMDVAFNNIQDRLAGGGAGGLALVEEHKDRGQLSLSDPEQGRLALAAKQTQSTKK